jgi:ABC-type nickel/cobalt efflux system permease component RcnA
MPALAEWLPLGTAFVLGFLHALEVDHMVAVTAFVATGPALATAARFGLRWGLGHSLAVFVAGGILLASGLRWAERYDAWGEALVGVMLIGVGAWAIRTTRQMHFHPPEGHGDHAHLHAHAPGKAAHHHGHEDAPVAGHHAHRRGITVVGLVHGLAGTSSVVALVPVTMVNYPAIGVGYLLAFGAGTIIAMSLFALLAAGAMRTAAARSLALGRGIGQGVGVAGILVGVWWIVKALG